MSKRQLPPDRVSSYFRAESGVLAVITVTGLLYNIGLVAGPWFEGQMTEALAIQQRRGVRRRRLLTPRCVTTYLFQVQSKYSTTA